MMPMRSARNAELLRARAHEANGALRVAELDRVMVSGTEPVLEDERRHAGGIEQVRDLPSLVIRRERAISAAGRDDDRGARRLARAENRQRRPIGHPLAQRAGRAVGPEEHRSGSALGLGLAWAAGAAAGVCGMNHSGAVGRRHGHDAAAMRHDEPHASPDPAA